jgi:hypothetical protein
MTYDNDFIVGQKIAADFHNNRMHSPLLRSGAM